LARINITGYEGLGDWGNKTSLIISENYQWNDAFTWVHVGHTFKFGGELARRRYNLFQYSDLRGQFNVGTIYSSNPAAPAGTGVALVDLLLGVPQSGVIAYVTGTRGYRRWEYTAFAQDTWKLAAALTLNIGLRYEVFAAYPWKEVAGRLSNFLPALGNVYVVRTPELPQASGTNSDLNNFGPRVGLAYKLGKRAVVRSAYGLFYSAEAIPATSLGGVNPPFVG
jgi:outer membrane receptor protein involved in Fe transport